MGLCAVVLAVAPAASAQTSTEELRALIEQLTIQVRQLQAQLNALEVRTNALSLSQDLEVGDRGEEVEVLQQVLASDPALYPEGLVTGYFGPLTQAALKRFEARYELDADGRFDGRARAVLNSLLEEGAPSGVVPPGLLTAPGLRERRVEVRVRAEGNDVRYEVKIKDSDDEDDSDEEDEEDEDEEDEDDDRNSGSSN